MEKLDQQEEDGRIIPIPDPTSLTTEALLREIKQLKELLRAENEGSTGIFNERLVAIDREFATMERHRIEQKSDTKAAVDAALIAQKEAVKEQTQASERAISKSEAATTKQLEQQASAWMTSINGVTAQLTDAKERITRLEGSKSGGTERSQNVNIVLIAILSIITIASLIMGVVQHLPK